MELAGKEIFQCESDALELGFAGFVCLDEFIGRAGRPSSYADFGLYHPGADWTFPGWLPDIGLQHDG